MTENGVPCPYCASFLAGALPAKLYDTVLIETENFVVVPSRGSLMEGWLLVVPKRHILSIAQLAPWERAEYRELVFQVSARIERIWRIVPTLFEHGASHQGDLIGCGINHAHLHMVPLPFSLSTAISSYETEIQISWNRLDAERAPLLDRQGQSYLYYSEPKQAAQIAYPRAGISQYFRRVIASYAGLPQFYDYKKHEFGEKIATTIGKFLSDTNYSCAPGRLAQAI